MALAKHRTLFVLSLIALSILLTLGLIVAFEIGIRTAAAVVARNGWQKLAESDMYGDTAWFGAYIREMADAGRMEWRPYAYWRRRAFAGRYINIDTNGSRRTWVPSWPQGDPTRVFVMGGSTVWGTGARDEHTIPSELARKLIERGFNVQVVNLGETGYVMRQDVTVLMSLLARGDIPDVVVFYGPFNDAFAALQNNAVGLSQNENNRRQEFNSTNVRSWRPASYVATTGIRRVVSRLTAAVRPNNGRARETGELELLGQQVAAHHCTVRRIVRGLAREYGFRAIFILQPIVFLKPTKSASEQRFTLDHYESGTIARTAYERILTDEQECKGVLSVQDLSRIFDSTSTPMFLDQVHVTELGNQIIAAQIASSLQELLPRP